ncbi:hypothetical protein EMM73_08085 [Rheinheimera sediminis]|uniref:hypothetical protein n=1 Tax=Rheinheimera sp. YQF-1 TaxID=2499626 RepID=UPI000FD7A7B9|nr:hypothetical protein [Rheinheimera sp. YQF-1]RVT46535.1 hypothetical protein EMM73_08085 [Rheinheimera sp. YQF-1]
MLRIRSAHFILISLAVYLLAIGTYVYYQYQHTYQTKLNQLDSQLVNAVKAMPFLLGDDYHNNISGPQHISRAEYLQLAKKLSLYAKDVKLQYVYSMVQVDGKVHFTSSSYTEDDLLRGQLSYFL